MSTNYQKIIIIEKKNHQPKPGKKILRSTAQYQMSETISLSVKNNNICSKTHLGKYISNPGVP